MLSQIHRVAGRLGWRGSIARSGVRVWCGRQSGRDGLVEGDPGQGVRQFGVRYYSGAYLNAVDAKNRLSVPAPLRETIESRSSQKQLVLAPAEHNECLVGYDLTRFEQLQAELAERFAGDYGPGRSDFARAMFGMAETLRYDENGRIILSPILKELARLDSIALLLGSGDYFEIWSPEHLMSTPGQDPRLIRTVRALSSARSR
jgi:MraZ protein